VSELYDGAKRFTRFPGNRERVHFKVIFLTNSQDCRKRPEAERVSILEENAPLFALFNPFLNKP